MDMTTASTPTVILAPSALAPVNTGAKWELRVFNPGSGYGELDRFIVAIGDDPTLDADRILSQRWGLSVVWADPYPTGARKGQVQ